MFSNTNDAQLESITSEVAKLSVKGPELAALKTDNAKLQRELDSVKKDLETTKLDFHSEHQRAEQLYASVIQTDSMRSAAAKENTQLRKDHDAWVEEKLNVMKQAAVTEKQNYQLTEKQKLLEAQTKTDQQTITRLDDEMTAQSQVYCELLKSYNTLKALIDEIQAGNIVKLCQDCPALRDQLKEAQDARAAAEERVTELDATIEETRRKNSEDYQSLEGLYSSACKERDKRLADLNSANLDIAKKVDTMAQMAKDSEEQAALLKNKTSALEKMETDLSTKSQEYNDVKEKLDKKCDEMEQLVKTHESALVSIRSDHNKAIGTLNAEHEEAKRAACEAIEKEGADNFNTLAGAKSRQELELQKAIDTLILEKGQLAAEKDRVLERVRSLMASGGVPSPISPQEDEAEGIFSDFKKRKLDQFEGSPESKSKRAWNQHALKISAILSSMVPDGPVDMHQAYYQISRCFALSSAVDNFKVYLKSGNEKWLCLASVLVLGVENTNAIKNATPICGWCQEMEFDCCVQVQWKLEVVRFRTANGMKE